MNPSPESVLVIEPGRFADQKYLDDWPQIFRRERILKHQGAGLAPWNMANYFFSREQNQVRVDSQLLIFFHFHGLKEIRTWLYYPDLERYRARASYLVRRFIFGTYIKELIKTRKWLTVQVGGQGFDLKLSQGKQKEKNIFPWAAKRLGKITESLNLIRRGQLFVVIGGRIL